MTSSLQYEPVAASFQPPPTQNTAPIIEHRCLYTSDLRRKAKRWQDGFLRYHTFNKRVMVYDVPRNFIGDTHWRDNDPIQDGDELELDRPILVQIGEQTGSVDQDLTELFDKRPRKKARLEQTSRQNSSSPPGPSSSNGTKQNNVMARQLVPKSLNALLGTPKGKLGRATLPTKSPFELRTLESSTRSKIQPLTKRHRMDSETRGPQSATKERTLRVEHFEEQRLERDQGQENICNLTVGATFATEQPRLSRVYSTGPQKENSKTMQTLTLPEMEVARPQTDSTSHPPHKSTTDANPLITQVHGAAHRQGHKSKVSRKSDISQAMEAIASCNASLPRDCEPSNIITILSDTETSSARSDVAPTARIRLQMASRKPRRKLMYKDLLPPSAIATETRPLQGGDSSYGTKSQVDNSGSTRLNEASQTKGTRDDFKRVRRKNREIEPTIARDQFCDDGASTPILDQENVHPKQQDSQNRPPIDITNRPKSPPNEPENMTIPRRPSTIHDTNVALVQMDEILLSRSQAPNSRAVKQRSPLQKSKSDMPRSTLARCISDLGKPDSSSRPISEAKEQIISPWSMEAWDLFGCGRDGEVVDFGGFRRKESI